MTPRSRPRPSSCPTHLASTAPAGTRGSTSPRTAARPSVRRLAARSCASSRDRSISPPVQEAARAERTVVAREDVERRAARGTRALFSVVALAAGLAGDDLVTEADPPLDRSLGFLVVTHWRFRDAAS